MPRHLLWVDGVNSAVMAKMVLVDMPEAIPIHCNMGDSVHPDSHRFIDDLENWYGKEIIRIKSEEHDNIDSVFEKRKYHAGVNGATCKALGIVRFYSRGWTDAILADMACALKLAMLRRLAAQSSWLMK